MLYNLYTDALYYRFSLSNVNCPWPHFHGSVAAYINCRVDYVNSSLIGKKITLFGIWHPFKGSNNLI